MIDEVDFDMGYPMTGIDQGGIWLPVDEDVSSLRSSQRKFNSSFFKLDLSSARRESDIGEKVTSAAIKTIQTAPEKSKDHADKSKKRNYTSNQAGAGGYLLGLGEMVLGGTLMLTGAVIEVGSFGMLTIAVGFQEAAGFALVTDGFARTMRNAQDVSIPKLPKYDPLLDIVNKPKEPPRKWDEPGSPPIRGDQIVGDGTVSPWPGFDEWKGKGDPSSGKGAWYNPETEQSLHPDLNHKPPKDPHWDYVCPEWPEGAELYLDGKWVPK